MIFYFIRKSFFAFLLIVLICYFFIYTPSYQSLTIGSKRFTESYILGEILHQLAEQTQEAPVNYRPGLGNTGILFTALKKGLIDIYPEYTGTIALEILKQPELLTASIQELNIHLAPLELGVSQSLGFHDNYALAMKRERAEELGIQNISDLAEHANLVFGFSHEFLVRLDGWKGLKTSRYVFPQTSIKGFDHSLSYEAIDQGKIDVIDIYSTDPKIEKYDLKILEDDHHFFPSHEGVLLYHLKAAKNFPKTWTFFHQKLENNISTKEMAQLNAQAELKGKSFHDIAEDFIDDSPQSSQQDVRTFWKQLIGPDLWPLTLQHLFLVFGALIPAIVIGLLLGTIAAYCSFPRHIILNSVGIIQTIPSLALLAFLIPIFKEIGTVPALVALFLYALLPIVRNTYTGLTNISQPLREAALALGLPFIHRLFIIEIPLASRMIIAGIKTAAVLNVGMATIAAFIGAGGYGERIVAGLALNDYTTLLAGAIPACVLAICIQLGFDLLDRILIPKGLRF